ncbi:hypothetical protein Tco_1369784 [Tanacetum coccineum]
MDEKTIRGWMKEQQDLAETMAQQAAAFQARFEALRAEFLACLGQLQGRPRGNGDQGSLLPRSMCLDVPKFTGEDPKRWWMSRNGLITDWERFKESVKNRFGPSNYEDPQGALSKLLQLGTVEEYQGLKLHLQRELLVAKSTTLGHKFPGKFWLLMADDENDLEPETERNTTDAVERVEVDLYVLPMKGPYVFLGIQWLQKLGKVTHDYVQQTMEFMLVNTTYTLKGDESLRMKRISLHHMHALLKSDDVYGIYELYNVTKEAEEVESPPGDTDTKPPDITQLLDRFGPLFQVPTTLPPHRAVDHRIHLLPNTKHVNVRPYRYPHYQKGEMEKLVNEMLEQGIIRFSQSPFASLVLLVKKKGGELSFLCGLPGA